MKIRSWDGAKIGAPGLYADIPIDFYHGDCCMGPSISSTGLRTIETKSPAHYWCTSPLNPQRLEVERRTDFDFGKAAHTLLLGEEGFHQSFITSPYDEFRTKVAKAWRDETLQSGKIILTEEDLDHIRGMAASLNRNEIVQAGIFDGLVEHSLLWQDDLTGIWLKSRPDVVPQADGMLVDLKTTADASPRAVEQSVANYRYDMQGALAAAGMLACCSVKITSFVLVFIEKTPPYAVTVREIDPRYLDIASQHLRRAINTFARCIENASWPAYEGESTIYAPQWLIARAEADEKAGLLPLQGLVA